MKRFSVLAVATAALLIGGAAYAAQGTGAGKMVTIQGTLIDTKCYGMMQENTGNDHQTPNGVMPSCGTACAATGIPVAVLKGGEAGGDVYVLITPAPNLAPHMAKEARVTGTLAFDGSLIPDKVEVRSEDGRWEEVNTATMM